MPSSRPQRLLVVVAGWNRRDILHDLTNHIGRVAPGDLGHHLALLDEQEERAASLETHTKELM